MFILPHAIRNDVQYSTVTSALTSVIPGRTLICPQYLLLVLSTGWIETNLAALDVSERLIIGMTRINIRGLSLHTPTTGTGNDSVIEMQHETRVD